MKKKVIVLASVVAAPVLGFIGLLIITGYQCCNSAADGTKLAAADRRPSGNDAAIAAAPERIGFYAVELRCPLVRGLGCGSDSKPIMTKLDASPAVAGSWLNHAGTTLAVFWNDEADSKKRSEILSTAFQDHDAPVQLAGDNREVALNDFRSGVAWYQTAAIDELSAQEADVVAEQWVTKMARIVPMPQKFREALRRKLSDEMRCRFVNS